MNDTVKSSQPMNCPCGDNDGLWCSLSGCPYPRLGPNEPLIFSDYVLHPAIKDVLDERLRQQSVEGWSLEHDDAHSSGEMAAAAATYAYSTTLSDRHRQYVSGIYSIENSAILRDLWPASWAKSWWKPTDRRRDLVKAAALLVAEIERLDRYASRSQSPVNRLDANAPILREQGRLAEQHQPDQGMTSTLGDAQTSYPPVDCSNGTAREQLAREGSCNASSLERSGSIDAEVDNTKVPGTPSPQTHVKGETRTRFHIEWIAGARPPVHPHPMTGRTT
ncbi:hypothetical protein GGQ72_004429, partial [Rhizobium rhizoryzae]|nr:hypothetical protein [Rhizobium rhizoryzae]